MIKIDNLLSELILELESKFKNNFTGLVLFGSYALGTQNRNSDLDIIVTFNKLPQNRLERLRLIEEIIDKLEDKYSIAINPIISNQNKLQKTYLMIDIAEYAKIILDKNSKLKYFFNNINEDYKNGLAKKKKVGDHYMLWVSDKISA